MARELASCFTIQTPKLLDMEFTAAVTQLDPNFNYQKMPSILELMGQQQEEYIAGTQNSLDDARKKSMKSSFEEFKFGT